MISPYSPTYTYSELFRSVGLSSRSDPEKGLCSRLSELINAKYVHLFSTARAALYYLLKAYDHPGGVIMPSFTCITVPEAVRFAGYYPEFVDVDYPSLDMNLDNLMEAIHPGVRVILGIHTFGLPCNVEKIREIARQKNLLFVEDAAPAFGAEYQGQIVGSFGDASLLSFNHGKVVSGETGGALITNNYELDQNVRRLLQVDLLPVNLSFSFAKAFLRKLATNSWLYPIKAVLQKENYIEAMIRGITPLEAMPTLYSKKCSPVSKSLISQQLDRLSWNIGRRRRIGDIYQEELAGLSWLMLPVIPVECSPAWVQFPVFVNNKMRFYKYMKSHNVDMSMNYTYSVAESFGRKDMPNSRRVIDTILGFPSYPALNDSGVKAICDLVREYSSER